MGANVMKVNPPENSKLASSLDGAYYFDAYRVVTEHKGRSPLEIWLDHVARTPGFINFMMTIRNKVVSSLGLKDLGHLGALDTDKKAADYQVGDRVGIFTLLSITENEVILGDSDKHLDVKLSVYKESGTEESVVMSTVVHTHNVFGKIYMLFVTPVHKLIVPLMLSRS